MLFCDKYYQSTIDLAGLTSIIMVNMRLFTDIESRVQIKAKFKKLLTEKKKEALDLLKHENFLAKWANAFDGIYYPENVKIFEAKDLDFERLRTPNEDSIGLTGSFFSQKNNREVLYESSQEHLIFQTMERLDNVVWYQEQPLKIPYNAGGYQNYYFPDLAVLTKNGRCIVVEVKLGWHFVLEISLRKTLAAIDFLHPKGIAFVMLDSRGQSLRNFPIINNSVISREKKLLSALDKYGDLTYIQYKHFLNGDLFSTREFVGFIVRNDLSFSLKPFNITRLPKGLSFSSLI